MNIIRSLCPSATGQYVLLLSTRTCRLTDKRVFLQYGLSTLRNGERYPLFGLKDTKYSSQSQTDDDDKDYTAKRTAFGRDRQALFISWSYRLTSFAKREIAVLLHDSEKNEEGVAVRQRLCRQLDSDRRTAGTALAVGHDTRRQRADASRASALPEVATASSSRSCRRTTPQAPPWQSYPQAQ
jgi:hypothetical protein